MTRIKKIQAEIFKQQTLRANVGGNTYTTNTTTNDNTVNNNNTTNNDNTSNDNRTPQNNDNRTTNNNTEDSNQNNNSNTTRTEYFKHTLQQVIDSRPDLDAPMPPSSSSGPQPPPPPPTKLFAHSQMQTYIARTTKVLKRPSEEQASSSSGPRPLGPGPAPGGAANPNPLGVTSDLYLQQAHLAASAQHNSAGLIHLQTRQAFLEEVQANNMSAGQPIFQTACLTQQNTFLCIDSRQNVIFIGPPNPGEPEATVYSTGGQPPAPGAPGAGAAAAPMNIAIPAALSQPAETYIGTPRRPRRPKTNRSTTRAIKFKKNNKTHNNTISYSYNTGTNSDTANTRRTRRSEHGA